MNKDYIYNEFDQVIGLNIPIYKVNWYLISCQKLSESVIIQFQDKVNWNFISKYQTLSESFIREFDLEISDTNWLYKDSDYKLEKIKDCGLYEIDGDYIIAYKSVKTNGDSVYASSLYNYQIGNTYESNADFDIGEENSFGLSAWTKEKAKDYYSEGKILKVKIYKEDIAALVQNENKIRCTKLTVIEEVKE